MTSIALPIDNEWPPLRFWTVQGAIWMGYGFALMLPWIGTYPVALMLPNKLVIAGTGIIASWLLRATYERLLPPTARLEASLAVAIVASAVLGMLWSVSTAFLLGRSTGAELLRFGVVEAGVPRFGGVVYEMMVLFIWSLAYLAARWIRPPRPAHGATDHGVYHPRHALVVARDSTRALVAEAQEIDWVEAAGDYVRVHTGTRGVLLRGTMNQYEAGLSASYVRIHRSTIVNVARVREVVARSNRELLVVLRDGTKLRASRTYSAHLKQALGL
jgi:hypothetical protein